MSEEDSKSIQTLISDAVAGGCRQAMACSAIGIHCRTYQRWKLKPHLGDQRCGPLTEPANKFTEEERANVISISTAKDFVNLSPHQIVPSLADKGEYAGSVSSFYRIMGEEKLLHHRGRSLPKQVIRPQAYETTKANQLYSWDITYLLSSVRGEYFYLYLFLDLFSRKIVGHEVHASESMELSSNLLQKICLKENIEKNQLHVHSDNGGPMKGATMLVTMQWLGVVPSFSRPSVSNDNPYSESLFKTLKYCPSYPAKPFENIEAARNWVDTFVNWYNKQHLHSGINFVTPESKHKGHDVEILKKRQEVYLRAQKNNPNRWSGKIRNWNPIMSVKLNNLKKDNVSVTQNNISKAA